MLGSGNQGRVPQPHGMSCLLLPTFSLPKRASVSIVIAALFSLAVPSTQATTINVPGGQPTIQAAINAASNGDTVVVAPGTYHENINFDGKAITVTSSGGPAVTIINGGGNGPVVLFVNAEGTASVLSGFTITNGNSNSGATQVWNGGGGGIVVYQASPTVKNNVITQNVACNWGGGIFVDTSPAAIIENNQITENTVSDGCAGGGGGGIAVEFTGSPQIIGNTISGNFVLPGDEGGGIYLFGVTAPIIENNVITNNIALFNGDGGGGIALIPDSSTQLTDNIRIIQNLIFGNTADVGGGIYMQGAQNGSILLTNNTIADNNGSTEGSAVYVSTYNPGTEYYNNILIGAPGETAFYDVCNSPGITLTMVNNDLFAPGAKGADTPNCGVSLAANGNISVDPKFLDGTANFHLQYGSPAVDTGDNSAPDLPSADFDGSPRIANGTIDMGAYELQPTTVSLSTTGLVFAAQAVGSPSPAQSVTISNTGSHSLLLAITLSPNFTETDTCATALAAGASCTIDVTFTPTSAGAVAGSLTLFDNASSNPQRVSLSGAGTTATAALSPAWAPYMSSESSFRRASFVVRLEGSFADRRTGPPVLSTVES